jgi:hypothetical protein
MERKPCPLGKVYVLPGDFSYTLRTAILPVGKILCPVSDLSYTLNTGKPARWENSVSGQRFILHFKYRKNLPVGKILCPVSDLSCTLNTGKPARWENSMSYPVIYPTLYGPETLPVGQIPPRSESSGQGRWNTFPKCAEFSVLVLHSWAPPLRLVSPSRRSERGSERA